MHLASENKKVGLCVPPSLKEFDILHSWKGT